MRYGGREQSILTLLKETEEELLRESPKNRKGKHSGSEALPQELPGVKMSDIDVAATIRANPGAFAGERQDGTEDDIATGSRLTEIRLKRCRKKRQMSILFVVDASRSQGNQERLAFVKGAVQAILQQAYTERNKVGVVVFGNKQAQLVLPFTKSVEFAAAQMKQLAARGNTPLAEGIRLAAVTLEQERRKHPENLALMVLLTDGKCNYDGNEGKPMKLALEAAESLRKKHFPMIVVDTENSVFGMGLAKKIADAAGGKYVELAGKHP